MISQYPTDAHFEAKTGCKSRPMKIVEGITAKMEKLLRCRKKAYRGRSDAERWKDIYKILFPLEVVPDPCKFLFFFFGLNCSNSSSSSILTNYKPDFETGQEHKGEQLLPFSDSQDVAEYESYLRLELPRCFKRALEAAINDDNDPIEEHLTIRVIDMYQDCQDLVLSSYRTTLEASSAPIPAFVPEQTIELISQGAEHNSTAGNNGISMGVDDSSNTYLDHQRQYDGNTTLPKDSTTMQSNKCVDWYTGNDFNYNVSSNFLGMDLEEFPSITSIPSRQTWNEVAVYPVQVDIVSLRHVDAPNSFE